MGTSETGNPTSRSTFVLIHYFQKNSQYRYWKMYRMMNIKISIARDIINQTFYIYVICYIASAFPVIKFLKAGIFQKHSVKSLSAALPAAIKPAGPPPMIAIFLLKGIQFSSQFAVYTSFMLIKR